MKQWLVVVGLLFSMQAFAAAQKPRGLAIAPGTRGASEITVVWDKPEQYQSVVRYHLYLNGKQIGTSAGCNYRIQGLNPETTYLVFIKSEDKSGQLSLPTAALAFTTAAAGQVLNILDFGAKADNASLSTKAIQNAINACPKFGTVLIPEGIFVSGALFLKSDMTLQIAKGATLKGSSDINDYLPMINNRFEGWELKSYASLINAGVINHKGGFSVHHLRICGQGTISGGGEALGAAMRKKSGSRSRGRLILLMNCDSVDLQGLTIQDPPCWTIQYVYCKGVSLHDLKITSTAPNGDGIDPDSSEDSYIFNCSFSTGDDCIAIKSGKNPEGVYIGKPTHHVRITDCHFIKGHGISIGSEMSGGVSDVLVRDCQAGPLLHGMQIKATKERGGYVKNIRVLDCQLQQITIFSDLPYNNDGAAAPEVPVFEDFIFKNLDLSTAGGKAPAIEIHGFKDEGHKLRHVRFENILLPAKTRISVSDAEDVQFINVKTLSGTKPDYLLKESTAVRY